MAPNQDQNYSSSSQSYDYEDGRTKVRMSSSQQTWSSSGSASNQQVLSMPAFPAVGLADLHTQMHNAAVAHHQSALQHMGALMNPQQQLGAPIPHLQSEDTAFGVPGQVQMQRSSRQVVEVVEETDSSNDDDSSEEESSEEEILHTYVPKLKARTSRTAEDKNRRKQEHREQRLRLERENSQQLHENTNRALQLARQSSDQTNESNQQAVQLARDISARTADNNAMLSSLTAQYRDDRELRRRQEQRSEAERAALRETGSKLDQRIRALEEKEARTRAQDEEHDREMRRLREENAQLNRELLTDAPKHRQELAEIFRAQAARQNEGTLGLDASYIKRIVQETQANQLSKADIEHIIQERVTNQLDGIARAKDIEAAGSRMQRALESMPAGATADQVERTVNKELGKAVNRLADKVQPKLLQDTSSSRRPMINADHRYTGALASRVNSRKQDDKRSVVHSANSRNDKALMRSEAEYLGTALSKHRKGRDDVSIAEPSRAQPARVASLQVTELPDDFPDRASQISSYERRKAEKGKKATSNLLSIPEASADTTAQPYHHSRKASYKASTMSKAKDRDGKNSRSQALTAVSEDSPHRAMDVVARMRSSEKSSNSDTASRVSSKSKGKDKTPTDDSQHGGRATRTIEGGSSATPSNALARSGAKHPPVSVVMPGLSGGDVGDLTKRTAGLELPKDFPDRASQISTWERNRSKKNRQPSRLAGASPLRQISMPPDDDVGDSKGLARIKKDK